MGHYECLLGVRHGQREKNQRAGGSEGPSRKAFVQKKRVNPDRSFR